MKRRIRSIFLLMSLCILGVNGFQGYWLYTNYQLQVQQFTRTVREALFEAMEKQQLTDARKLFRSQTGESPERIIIRRFDTDAKAMQVERKEETRLVRPMPGPPRGDAMGVRMYAFRANTSQRSKPLTADTLARRISNMLIVNWTENRPFNLPKLDSLYRAELLLRGIDEPYQLDTLQLATTEQTVRRTEAGGTNTVKLLTLPTQAPTPEHGIQTPPVPVNPVSGQFAVASFGTPTGFILRKMGWLLGGSGLLLVLTTGCFLFMLSTILKQKKLSEIKNDFINNMTHELKTPIATVSAAVEAMQHFGALNDPKKTETYLSISKNELQRLSDLVEKVLNMAVEEQRELVLNPEPVSLSELVAELVQRHSLRAPKPVDFEVQIPASETVRVDKIHFANILNNLIDNAIKYSGEAVNIRLGSIRQGREWRLTVADNGKGIPKGYQEAIFDRFFRVPTGNLHPVKGFGLGLYYVRQVVEKHGGRIGVQSEPGKGSTFYIHMVE